MTLPHHGGSDGCPRRSGATARPASRAPDAARAVLIGRRPARRVERRKSSRTPRRGARGGRAYGDAQCLLRIAHGAPRRGPAASGPRPSSPRRSWQPPIRRAPSTSSSRPSSRPARRRAPRRVRGHGGPQGPGQGQGPDQARRRGRQGPQDDRGHVPEAAKATGRQDEGRQGHELLADQRPRRRAGDAKTLDKLAKQLSKLKGVSPIRAPKVYPLVKPVEAKVAILAAAGDPEWGVEKIRADEAWADGILGQGIVVANVDTGVDYIHPALVEQYRGNNGDGTFTHDYNWWDPTGICGDEPCDNVGHGTHTMGTMVGGDGPGPFTPDTGVAPGARWIAAKGCEDFGCTERVAAVVRPVHPRPDRPRTATNPDPSLRPDIVNNSWGSGPGDPFYLETVQAWRAAGHHPGLLVGQPRPVLRRGRFARRLPRVVQRRRDRRATTTSPTSPAAAQSIYGKVNPDVAAPGVDVVSRPSPVAATRPSAARPWPPPTSPARSP